MPTASNPLISEMKWLVNDSYQLCPTIYYQGISNSQTQMAKYLGSDGFVATTGEVVRYKSGLSQLNQPLDIIKQPFVGAEAADVDIQPFQSFLSYFNPLKLGMMTKSWLANWWYNIEVIGSSDDMGSVAYHSLELSQLSIGQQSDIDAHQRKYDALTQPSPTGKILFGVSRGAATTFNALALNDYHDLRLVVLEGCFDSVENVLQQRYGMFKPIASRALQALTAYRADGASPIDNIDSIPDGIPMVFISSLIDKEVPYQNTVNLALELAKTRTAPVYLLTLENSSHSGYMHDDMEDRRNYQQFMHAIYRKYGLAHIPYLAEKGDALLEESLLNNAAMTEPGVAKAPAMSSSGEQRGIKL